MAVLSVTVPDALVPRVIAALRAQYPDLTDPSGVALADGLAAKAVLKQFIRQTVQHYEGNQVRTMQRNQVTAAEQTAWNDLGAIS